MNNSARAAIVGHPIAQPLVFVALALIYIWIIQPTRFDPMRIPFLAVIVFIPFASSYLHRDGPKVLGLRIDNLARSALEVGAVTALGAVLVLGVGFLWGTAPQPSSKFMRALLLYPFWGLAQQYAMQSFTYRRMREGLGRPALAAGGTAVLFASAHWPNVPLTLLTLCGGFVWCLLFERRPNLIALALSHGWLAVLLRYSWPAEWLHNLRIGPGYWSWTP